MVKQMVINNLNDVTATAFPIQFCLINLLTITSFCEKRLLKEIYDLNTKNPIQIQQNRSKHDI